ncbi:ANTAR domain-containing protein [Geodermatophilus obscurus]|uniref:ANTAR domain-containing protein n=2 Tax=Geodermatophilus obscurus TaxID=1861 RepID=A0A1M7SJK5_9ACTN|nr:ANTAR domain-containing protein [Geodermatophilus obscurus]
MTQRGSQDAESPMTIAERFAVAVARSASDLPGVELLPERLARACAEVLPVDGAGISLFFASDRRLPLGASDDQAAVTERLQFTVGEGPCLTAHASGRPVVAQEAEIGSRWPAFYDELVTRTAVRDIISLPLVDETRGFGALDLYLVPPNDVRAVALSDALAVASEVVSVFSRAGRADRDREGPAWLDAPAAERRSLVWQAMGFVNAGLEISSDDALALLRAHAYSEGLQLDDLAVQVLSREIPLERLGFDRDQAS